MRSSRRKKAPSLRAAWKRQARLERLARTNEQLTVIRQKLAVISLAELICLAAERGKDPLRVEARKVFAERTGQDLEEHQKALAAQEREEKRKKSAVLQTEYESKSDSELYQILAAGTEDSALAWQMLRKRQRKATEDERKRLERGATVVVRPQSTPKKRQADSGEATDYMKPMSADYDMPEYDLE